MWRETPRTVVRSGDAAMHEDRVRRGKLTLSVLRESEVANVDFHI